MTEPTSRRAEKQSRRVTEPVVPHRGNTSEGLLAPGLRNVVVCYAFTLTALLSPLALFFAVRFAQRAEEIIYAHYYYIRTTIALLVIGFCLASLMILLGADLSSTLILAGLVVLVTTFTLTLVRCALGIFCALQSRAPRTYKSYLL